jgi:hypothetical protein
MGEIIERSRAQAMHELLRPALADMPDPATEEPAR